MNIHGVPLGWKSFQGFLWGENYFRGFLWGERLRRADKAVLGLSRNTLGVVDGLVVQSLVYVEVWDVCMELQGISRRIGDQFLLHLLYMGHS